MVTAVIATRNRAHLLERAVRSVLAQTHADLEIIIVDDASTDATPDLILELERAHSRIRSLRNEQPLGAPASRNRGIEAAEGRFIAGLDDDDEWHPQRIERLLAAYRPTYSCVTSDVWLDDGRTRRRWRKKRVITLNDLLLTNMVGNQVLAERERILAVGGFDESLAAAQDYDLWVRLCAAFGPIRNVKAPLQTIHVGHDDRITASAARYRGYLQFYRKHRGKMNRMQRKYQLYSIRAKTGRPTSLTRTLVFVPARRLPKELMRMYRSRGGWTG